MTAPTANTSSDPTLQVDVNENGEIVKLWGDLRLFEAVISRVNTPAYATIIAQSNSGCIIPDGTRLTEPVSLDDQPDQWVLQSDSDRRYYLHRFHPHLALQLQIDKNADRSRPEPGQVQVDVEYSEFPGLYEDTLDELSAKPGLGQCIISLVDGGDEPAYLGNTSEIANFARALRLMKDAFFKTLRSNPLPEEEEA